MTQALRFAGAAMPKFSIAASSGIFLGADFHLDPGSPRAALYGVAPPSAPQPDAPGGPAAGKILQIRDVDLGMTVGYGASHKFQRPSRMATIGAGYADGIPRAGEQGRRLHRWKTGADRGSMSQWISSRSISATCRRRLPPGPFVDILGPQQPVDDLARDAGTIGYEVLTAWVALQAPLTSPIPV